MTGWPGDNPILAGLFGDAKTAALIGPAAEVTTMIAAEVALARAQGALGLIPAEAAEDIAARLPGLAPDPAALAGAAARDGVPVPGLVALLRDRLGPGAGDWLHWGATSQDILDTALSLRLAGVLALWEARLRRAVAALGQLAQAHADLSMLARTYGQAATVTTFGAVAAGWGRPLLRQQGRIAALREVACQVSLSGAAGTSAALGPRVAELRAAMARDLGLGTPDASWHTDRNGPLQLGGWMVATTAACAKMGEDLILACQSGIGEVVLSGGGRSSTMPQKQNPVAPSALVALGRHVAGLQATLAHAAVQRQARDGAAWFTEWLVLPQMLLATGQALALAADLAQGLTPQPLALARNLATTQGTHLAEAASMILAPRLGRAVAQALVARLCAQALAGPQTLPFLLAQAYPEVDWVSALAPDPQDPNRAETLAFARQAASVGV